LLLSKLEAVVFLAFVLLIAINPLVFFVPRLASLCRQGILDYGTLGRLPVWTST